MRTISAHKFGFLAAGVVVGALVISPAGAHVTDSIDHLWENHIRPRVRHDHYTKAESRGRFAEESDVRALNRQQTAQVPIDPTFATVLSQTVPEGRWVFIASTEVDNDAPLAAGTVTCRLRDVTHDLTLSERSLYADQQSDPAGDVGARVMALQGAARLTEPAQVRLQCREISGDPDAHADNSRLAVIRANILNHTEEP